MSEIIKTTEQQNQKPPRPSSHLALSIIVTSLCCLPFGVVGIVYAAGVDAAYNAGEYEEAKRESKLARNWSLAGIVGGVLVYLFYIIAIVVSVTLGSSY